MNRKRIRRRGAIALGILLCGLGAPSRAMSPVAVQQWFKGAWSGDEIDVTFDVDRLQANILPDKPFQWEAFTILDITGSMVVFDIGKQRYFARIGKDTSMTLTSSSLVGQHVLYRKETKNHESAIR